MVKNSCFYLHIHQFLGLPVNDVRKILKHYAVLFEKISTHPFSQAHSTVHRIQDLKPGVEYSVCVTAWLDGMCGSASEPTLFRTPACEPDQPSMPKLISRTRTSLQLRWAAATDNGLPVTHYVLESYQQASQSWQVCKCVIVTLKITWFVKNTFKFK